MTNISEIKTFSEMGLCFITESNWFTPSKYKLYKKTDLNITDFQNYQKPEEITCYKLKLVISSTARVFATIAVYCFLAPVGVVYHLSLSSWHYKEIDLREKHLECLGLEVLKIAIVTTVIYRKIFNLPLSPLFFPSVILSLFTLANIAFYPLYYVENDNLPLKTKLALKWEFGIDIRVQDIPYYFLNKLINLYASKVLDTIRELQSKLPENQRIPFDLSVDIHKILLHLDETREDVDEMTWANISPIREKLSEAHMQMTRLQNYVSYNANKKFPIQDKRIIQNAYTNDFTIPLVDERPIRDRKIHSLTQELFKKMYSCNWISPSEVPLRKITDLGSIAKTMENIELFPIDKGEKVVQNRYIWGMQCVARVISGIVFIGIGTTAGTTYHTLQAFRFLGCYIIGKENLKFYNWQVFKAHSKAAFDDLTPIHLVFGGAITRTVNPFTIGIFNIIAQENDRAGIFTSMILKNKFGLVSNDGNLLSYSPEVNLDREPFFTKHHKERSELLFNELQKLYNNLDDTHQSKLVKTFNGFTETGRIEAFDKEILRTLSLKKRQKYLDLLEEVKLLASIIDESYYVTKNQALGTDIYSIKTPYYYQFKGFANGLPSQDDTWHKKLNQAIHSILKIGIREPFKGKKGYDEFKNKAMNRALSPNELFGFHVEAFPTEEMINKNYRKLSLLFHPDTIGQVCNNRKEEAKILFEILNNAKDFLIDSL